MSVGECACVFAAQEFVKEKKKVLATLTLQQLTSLFSVCAKAWLTDSEVCFGSVIRGFFRFTRRCADQLVPRRLVVSFLSLVSLLFEPYPVGTKKGTVIS